MDQEQEQTPDAPHTDVQPSVDAPQSTEVPESVGTYETPAESASQIESVPVNPFAAPEVSESVTPPESTGPALVPSPFAAAPQVEEVPPVFSTAPAPTPVAKKSYKGVIIVLVIVFVLALAAAIYSFYTHL